MHKSSDKTLARSIQPQTMPKTFTLEQDRVYEGVRYVQQPLGYPTDGHREVATDFLMASAAYFECPVLATLSLAVFVPQRGLGFIATKTGVMIIVYTQLRFLRLYMPGLWYTGGPMFAVWKSSQRSCNDLALRPGLGGGVRV